MAKLTVRNVGPIREAELEVKKHTVFIGPQGTGKSTLAKLIAMCYDSNLFKDEDRKSLLRKYAFNGWLNENSELLFVHENYEIILNEYMEAIVNDTEFSSVFSKRNNWLLRKKDLADIENGVDDTIFWKRLEDAEEILSDIIKRMIPFSSEYIPSERNLMALLSANLWALNSSNTSIPLLSPILAENSKSPDVKIKLYQ
ncbi:AAA family ATPase [Spirosoma rhododendri]|uniref:AAA family ATPase n=1 Tax=Spirosoma rhododendri TaxID=2728024 RepID=UPI0020C1FC6C|nr:AAA family ATPase [Spirosoma rhododendri]